MIKQYTNDQILLKILMKNSMRKIRTSCKYNIFGVVLYHQSPYQSYDSQDASYEKLRENTFYDGTKNVIKRNPFVNTQG